MNLLERYLQAIGQYLPASNKDDVLAELRANLQAQIDDSAEKRGHPLTDHEIADVLLAHGNPELVARHYLPRRSLIGPALFPIYTLTLRRALPLVLTIYAIVHAIPLVSATNDRVLAHGIADDVFQLVPTMIVFWFWITLVFAIVEAVQYHYAASQGRPTLSEDQNVVTPFARTKLGSWLWQHSADWDPMKLPPAIPFDQPKPKSFAVRLIELALQCLWLAYVLIIPYNPFLLLGPGVYYLNSLSIRFAPVWHTFYLILLALLSIQLLIKLLALRNRPQPWQVPLELITRAVSAVAVALLAFSKTYFLPDSPTANLQSIAATTTAMNLGFRILLLIIVVTLIIDIAKAVRRHLIPTRALAF
jgi:hypothetical protein